MHYPDHSCSDVEEAGLLTLLGIRPVMQRKVPTNIMHSKVSRKCLWQIQSMILAIYGRFTQQDITDGMVDWGQMKSNAEK